MCGDGEQQAAMFGYVTMAQRIPTGHPVRALRAMVDRVDWFYRLTIAAHNLVRMRRPIPIQAVAA